MCRYVDMIQLKIDNEYKYLSTNITTTTRTTQLHEIEINLWLFHNQGYLLRSGRVKNKNFIFQEVKVNCR